MVEGRLRLPRSAPFALSVALGLLSSTRAARADSDMAAAETLFRDGMRLFDAGQYDEGCPKLAASKKIDPASGTAFALALCDDRRGKSATAWAEYIDAATLARRDGRQDREAAAKTRAAELEPHLSLLTVRIEGEPTMLPGLEVRRDDESVPPSAWGTPIPIDPGDHVVEARAPGKRRLRLSVRVAGNGERKIVVVPMLEDDERPTVERGIERPPESRQGTRTVGFIVGGAGIAAIGAGAFFGVRAIDLADASKERCPTSRCSDVEAIDANDDARTTSLLSNVFVGAGLVATAVGVYLVIRSYGRPSPTPASKTLAPLARLGPLGVTGVW